MPRPVEEAQIFPHVGELGRVVEHQNRASHASHALAGRAKVSAEDVSLANPFIVKEAIGSLGVGPVLARQGNALTSRFKTVSKRLPNRRSRNSQPNTCFLNPRFVTVGMSINQWQL